MSVSSGGSRQKLRCPPDPQPSEQKNHHGGQDKDDSRGHGVPCEHVRLRDLQAGKSRDGQGQRRKREEKL